MSCSTNSHSSRSLALPGLYLNAQGNAFSLSIPGGQGQPLPRDFLLVSWYLVALFLAIVGRFYPQDILVFFLEIDLLQVIMVIRYQFENNPDG